jgi:hypothetical protein
MTRNNYELELLSEQTDKLLARRRVDTVRRPFGTVQNDTTRYAHGLCPKLSGDVETVLSGIGTWIKLLVGLTGAFSPDNCKFYQWRPRGIGFVTGEWFLVKDPPPAILLASMRNPDNNLDYLWVPRLSGPNLSGEWVLTTLYPPLSLGRFNIDDELYYNWVPRLAGTDITGEWQSVCV